MWAARVKSHREGQVREEDIDFLTPDLFTPVSTDMEGSYPHPQDPLVHPIGNRGFLVKD